MLSTGLKLHNLLFVEVSHQLSIPGNLAIAAILWGIFVSDCSSLALTMPSDSYGFFHSYQVALTDWVRRGVRINGLLGLLSL